MKRAPGRKTRNSVQPNTRGKGVWDKAFLTALAHNGVVTYACEAAGIGRRTAYDRRETDTEFAAAWEDAVEEARDRIEAEAIRRAVDGYDAPVWYQGELVGTNREYSDSLMQLVLKGNKPDKYGDKLIIKLKPEWASVFDEAGKSPADILEDFVQRYHRAKAEVNNG